MKKLAFSVVAAVLSFSATAQSLVTVQVDPGYHHIGDNFVAGFSIPSAEGVIYQKTVKLPAWVGLARVAFVEMKARDLDFVDFEVNGKVVAIPSPTDDAQAPIIDPFRTIVFGVPAGFFISGDNLISIKPRRGTDNNYDDLEFGDLKIHFQ